MWSISATIEGGSNLLGVSPSLAFDSAGSAFISYASNSKLKWARKIGTGNWLTENIDTIEPFKAHL